MRKFLILTILIVFTLGLTMSMQVQGGDYCKVFQIPADSMVNDSGYVTDADTIRYYMKTPADFAGNLSFYITGTDTAADTTHWNIYSSIWPDSGWVFEDSCNCLHWWKLTKDSMELSRYWILEGIIRGGTDTLSAYRIHGLYK